MEDYRRDSLDGRRLIEAGFPCHQVGAETQRERGSSNVMPPVYYLHVWWARRPLIPSRAAILASLLPAGTDPETFVRRLGIERVQALVHGEPWTLTGKLLERIELRGGREVLPVDAVVQRAYLAEQQTRGLNRDLVARLKAQRPDFVADPVVRRWQGECSALPDPPPEEGEALTTIRSMGDPAWANEKMAFTAANAINFPGDAYGYARAFGNVVPYKPSPLVVLDPTSGGGSIPFEALRSGYRVITNELNPVATAILHATIDFPARFGPKLLSEIDTWGRRLLREADAGNADLYADGQPIPPAERQDLESLLGPNNRLLITQFDREQIQDYLYTRQVTCPHCGGEAPLLNAFWLSKEKDDKWGVSVEKRSDKTASFRPYRIVRSHRQGDKIYSYGPNGEEIVDQDRKGTLTRTVTDGVGQCVHCKQAIDGDEIKRQAHASAKHPTPMADCPDGWQDRLYAVVAVRLEPKLDSLGQPQRYSSGARKGEIKTTKVRYFRPPNQRDLDALAEAQRRLRANWDAWDAQGLIPTERFPEGNDMRPVIYGMPRWCDLFTPRQLLGHLTLIETLNRLKPEILARLGAERARAVMTYLQFAIDKGLDYNSRQTRWEFTRGVVKGTFGRHDFSLKWTFGEMIFYGPNSGAAWGLEQATKAYRELADLVAPIYQGTGGAPPVTIINGTAAHIPQVGDGSVDLICMDPPYYNNVQYAELSDYFYVWQRRTLRDLYSGLYDRRLTDKKVEAVANPVRDGSAQGAKAEYERLMGEIFRECRRTLKDDGLFTLMFTHKSQDAWETLTRSLIDAGWVITACFPVESEGANSTHQKDMAAAASSIFIACRKRMSAATGPAVWQGFGGQGVRYDIEHAVQTGLADFAPLHLNPVDEMIASYGKALQVLSSHWPVQDGNELVNPLRAMNEASRVVAQSRVSRITQGKVRVADLDSETAMALTILGIWECAEVAYNDILLLSKSLGIALANKTSASGTTGYRVNVREVGVNAEARGASASRAHAPLLQKGSKLRLALPAERESVRLANPQTDWDRLHGLIMAYREGDIPVARAYLQRHAADNTSRILDLLEVWAAEARDPLVQKEARVALYGLGR